MKGRTMKPGTRNYKAPKALIVTAAISLALSSVSSAGASATDRSAKIHSFAQTGAGPSSARPASQPGGVGLAPPERQEALSQPLEPATGQISAQDGKFWLGAQPIVLHGIDADPMLGASFGDPGPLSSSDFARMASWNMNFARLRMDWGDVEWQAPTQNGITWTHTYDAKRMASLVSEIQLATNAGLYVMIESNMNTDHYPNWLWQAPYNSHHKDYPFGDTTELNTDFWSDALMQQFLGDYLVYITGQFKGLDGVVGIELIDEPNTGNLELNSEAVNAVVNVQFSLAQRVRAQDASRVIFFTTTGGLGGGLPLVDFTQWRNMGNVAFDLHGYFGARWGVGILTDPSQPNYGLVNGTLLADTIMDTSPSYLGTTFTQMKTLEYFFSVLGHPGDPGAIPIVIGEFGGNGEAEPNIMTLMGTMTQAFNLEGVAWAVWSYNGQDAILKPDGTNEPWVPLLAAAAGYGR